MKHNDNDHDNGEALHEVKWQQFGFRIIVFAGKVKVIATVRRQIEIKLFGGFILFPC